MGLVTECVIIWGLAMVCLHEAAEAGLLPKATNITWESILFRTELRWEPSPVDFVYTVRVKGKRTDWKRKVECTHKQITRCDVTSLMGNLTDTYNAEILTYSLESTDEREEAPYAEALQFTPYKDTKFGEAAFEIILINKTQVRLSIKDHRTFAKFPNGSTKTLKDIYGDQLTHMISYFKDGTSGKKPIIANGQEEMIKIEEDFKYCFTIQPRVISLNIFGPISDNKCTTNDINPLGEYNVGVFAAVILGLLVLVIAVVVVVAVVLRKRKLGHEEAEMHRLKPV